MLFSLGTRQAVEMALKHKIDELAASSSASSDSKVSEWLQSIKPALDEVLAGVQNKRKVLV